MFSIVLLNYNNYNSLYISLIRSLTISKSNCQIHWESLKKHLTISDTSLKINLSHSRTFSRKGDVPGMWVGGGRDGITSPCHGRTVVPLYRAGHPEPCVPGCLFGSNPVDASRSHPSAVTLASIESRTFYTLLDQTIIVTCTTIISLFVAVYSMEVEELGALACQEEEAMLVDGLEQGLPFPHVVGEDGQHSVQHIDM